MNPYDELYKEIREMQIFIKDPREQCTALVVSNETYQFLRPRVLIESARHRFAKDVNSPYGPTFITFEGLFDDKNVDICRRADRIAKSHPELEFYPVKAEISMHMIVAIAGFDSYHYWSPLLVDPKMNGMKAKVLFCKANLY